MATPTAAPSKSESLVKSPGARSRIPNQWHPLALSQELRRHWRLRGPLVALEGLVALTAIQGAIFVVPALPKSWLQQGAITPFTDFTIPAVALGVVCGGSALLALVTVVTRPWIGALASIVAGLIMVGFEAVEIAVVGFTPMLYPAQPQAWLQPFYLAVGAAMSVLGGYLWWVLARSFRLVPIEERPRRQ